MLSIGAMQSGNGRYYLELAREDYYLEGGEPPGRWWGRGAKKLDLGTRVDRDGLGGLLKGFSPAGKPLTQNAGRARHQPGWDLTFSAPKSVSVLWSLSDAEMRRKIQTAHEAAVKAALSYLQDKASQTRRGRGGAQRERAGLTVAMFEHGTSRAQDPLLHTHCLVLNAATREDGTTGSLLSRPLYRHKMAMGVTYRVELAHQLEQRLGLRCERTRSWFEVAGVPKALRDHFSKRRKAIKDRLGEMGLETASAAAYAALDTRQTKAIVAPRKTLFQRWRSTAQEFGFGPKEAFLLRGKPPERNREALCRKALREAVQHVTDRESHFAERDLVRHAMEAAQGTGLSARLVLDGLKRALQDSGKFIELGQHKGEVRYTTAEILKTEKTMLEAAERSRGDTRHVIRSATVDDAIKRSSRPRSAVPGELKHHAKQLMRAAQKKKTSRLDRKALRASAKRTINLSAEQTDAVRHLTQTPGRVKVLTGLAGTGKTTTLAVCREVWEKSGFTVLGAALSGRAVHELAAGSGITSDTLAMLQKRMEPSVGYQLKHHTKQLWRTARHKSTYKLERLKINKKTVLVIDEAGMVGTKQMAHILEAVHRQGGKVVLVGDDKQLQPIEMGGPFRALAEQLGCASLKGIARQFDARDREVVRDMMSGDAKAALENLADRGLVSVSPTHQQAMKRLIADWSTDGAARPGKTLIFAGTNEDVDAINRLCQQDRVMTGVADPSQAVAVGDGHLLTGDRVLFTKRSREFGLENGWTGTVLSVNRLRKRIAVKLDNGRRVVVPLKRYKHKRGERKGQCAVRLGYAITTHKGQGSTVDKAYILAGGRMQYREIAYVQASRARRQTRLYTDELEAGKDLTTLARRMSTSRAKDLAHDVVMEQQRQRGREQER